MEFWFKKGEFAIPIWTLTKSCLRRETLIYEVFCDKTVQESLSVQEFLGKKLNREITALKKSVVDKEFSGIVGVVSVPPPKNFIAMEMLTVYKLIKKQQIPFDTKSLRVVIAVTTVSSLSKMMSWKSSEIQRFFDTFGQFSQIIRLVLIKKDEEKPMEGIRDKLKKIRPLPQIIEWDADDEIAEALGGVWKD
jgi:hypothetical protein